jgi:hypothetical protein
MIVTLLDAIPYAQALYKIDEHNRPLVGAPSFLSEANHKSIIRPAAPI